MDKRGRVTVSVIVVSIVLVSIFAMYFVLATEENWTIDGNKVYVDDTKVYISAEPHTLQESGWVTFDIKSKVYSGNVDLTFGFDTDKLKPVKAELYSPHNVSVYNSSCTLVGNSSICNGYYYNVVEEWKDISGVFESINYDYGGMNKWWYLRNVPVTANTNYKLRVLVSVKVKSDFTYETVDTKYWFAIKPSSETISQAISNNHLYALDPWFNSTGQNQNKDYLANGLVAYWNFDVDGNDSTEYGHTCSGSAVNHLSNGILGGYYHFTSTQNLSCTNKTDLKVQNFTYSFWSNMTSGNTETIIRMPTVEPYSSYNFLYGTYLATCKQFYIKSNSGTVDECISMKNPNRWEFWVITYDGTTTKFYLNGSNIQNSTTASGLLNYTGNPYFFLGHYEDGANPFNGGLDEIGIWNRSLNESEITDLWNGGVGLSYSKAIWNITFNVTDSYYGTSLNNVIISCNSTGFNQGVDTTNPYGPYVFENGSYECNFADPDLNYYNKTMTFIADNDKTIPVLMSQKKYLTVEEHTWLEAIYNCLFSGDCSLYDLLLEVNQTVGKIWDNTKPTDSSVVTFENITNKIVDSTHNLTIDYTVNIPIKAGYSLGTYLPVRIGYWFLDNANTTCYNQGTKPAGVEEPYCQPLIVETLGPMGGSVSLTVKLHPELSVGNYSIKRIIDIDPNNIWINYGQEMLGSFVMAEELSNSEIAITKTGEDNPAIVNNQQSSTSSSSSGGSSGGSSEKKVINVYNVTNIIVPEDKTKDNEGENMNKPTGITGGVIKELLPKGSTSILLGILAFIFIISIISKKFLKVKSKN